ncbi:MAG: hypothetical protein O3B42_03595 [Actinomycetota bacterium]|nr:hypothetical protein [Actinomycetota bacterium]
MHEPQPRTTLAPSAAPWTTPIDPGPKRRHSARVAQFSRDADRLLLLDAYSVDDATVGMISAAVCADFGIAMPQFKFNARRSPYTGACEPPRSNWVQLLGEPTVAEREANGWGSLPQDGAIRLGRRTTLMTLAHELGHHAVFHLDPPNTPAHGRIWVLRFDQAAWLVRDETGVGEEWLLPVT